MASDPWLEASFDAERIAFVTRRYEALRGLTNALIGAVLLISALALQFLHASTAYPLLSHAAVMWLINVPFLGALEFEVRYRATFGRAEAPFEFATLPSWIGIYALLGAFMDGIIMDRAPLRWPSSAGIALALSSGVVLLMDWRWRLTPFHGVAGQPAASRRRSASLRTMSAGLVATCALLTLCAPVPQMALVLPISIVFVAMLGGASAQWFIRRLRRLRSAQQEQTEPFGLHRHTSLMFVVLATAALVDVSVRGPAPICSTIVFALCSFWIALRDWPFRKFYLVGAVLPMVVLPLAARLEPARSFTLLLFACTAALTIESALDGCGDTPTPCSEPEDADTI